jgi:hypothetical protein
VWLLRCQHGLVDVATVLAAAVAAVMSVTVVCALGCGSHNVHRAVTVACKCGGLAIVDAMNLGESPAWP